MDGIYRGFFVAVSESSRFAQIFVPTLHRKLMPFKTPSNPKDGIKEGIDLKNYPLAQFACPGVFVTPEIGDTAWIAFENGDPNYPIVIGQIGTALPEGDVITAIYGGGNGGGGGLDSGTSGGGYLTGCDKYTLDDDTINWIAHCVTGECGGSDLLACRQEASQMANLHETHYGKTGRDSASIKTTVKRASQGGWYADTSWDVVSGPSDNALQAVRDVFINGNRYLPRYVCNHDWFPGDVVSPIKDRSEYTKGEQITTKYTSDAYFYCFFGSDNSGDIAMYCKSCYSKRKDDDEKMQQSTVSGGGNKAAEEFIKIMNAGYEYGRGANQHDCSSSTCEALYQAGILPNSGKSYSTKSFGTSGSKFIEYGFVDVTSTVWPNGDKSSYSKMQPGDILWCYDEHMTMYVGEGKIGLMSSSKGCRLGNYYTDSRITNVFRYGGNSSK